MESLWPMRPPLTKKTPGVTLITVASFILYIWLCNMYLVYCSALYLFRDLFGCWDGRWISSRWGEGSQRGTRSRPPVCVHQCSSGSCWPTGSHTAKTGKARASINIYCRPGVSTFLDYWPNNLGLNLIKAQIIKILNFNHISYIIWLKYKKY